MVAGCQVDVDDTQKNETRTCRLPLQRLHDRPVTDANFGGRGFPT